MISPLGVARTHNRIMEKYSDLTTRGGAHTRQDNDVQLFALQGIWQQKA